MILAVYPGTFDPMTLGHLDMVRRAARLFDFVTVAVAASPKKKPLFTLEERVELARLQCADLANVAVEGFDDLLCRFVARKSAQVIVRSSRAATDFEYELQMAMMNRHLVPEAETVFLTPSAELQYVSGTLVREIALLGGDVTECVVPAVAEALARKAAHLRGAH